MIRVEIKGLDQVKRHLTIVQKQARFAAARTLTSLGKLVEKELQGEMAGKFDRPSPYTKRSTFSTTARKDNLTVKVGIKDQAPAGGTVPALLLKEHFGGGVRGGKPMEKVLASLGALPSGWRVIPGAGMKLDAYGNPKRKEVAEVLGALRTGMRVHKGRGKAVSAVGYFVIRPGSPSHLAPGVYRRINREAIRPVFLFVQAARYSSRFSLHRIAEGVVKKNFDREFARAFDQAMSTAR